MEDEQSIVLVRKFVVCDTAEWSHDRLYWNVGIGGWVNLHNERTPPTLFDKMGDAIFLAAQLDKFVTTIHTDPG